MHHVSVLEQKLEEYVSATARSIKSVQQFIATVPLLPRTTSTACAKLP
ncbi:hypothetical protein IPL85_00260 [Candidatus Saccharibacteria bacterium]|nr:MAG: hypothetical protein IPL85_00260 [Candidatus Saccharibacteria bacterium]